jgi:hypothetical protein
MCESIPGQEDKSKKSNITCHVPGVQTKCCCVDMIQDTWECARSWTRRGTRAGALMAHAREAQTFGDH